METHTARHRVSPDLNRRRNRQVEVSGEIHYFRVNLPEGAEPWWDPSEVNRLAQKLQETRS